MASTPISVKSSGTSPFTSNHYYDNDKYDRMAHEMHSKFIGPMQPDAFLDQFLPRRYGAKRPWKWDEALKAKFKTVAGKAKETEMYTPLIEALDIACGKDLKLIDTSAHPDPFSGVLLPGGLKPDISAYKPDYQEHQPGSKKWRTDFLLMEIHIELKKSAADDGFEDDGDTFERTADSGISTRGQITSYATAQLGLQFRTHVFSVLLCGSNARLLRWDRTGAIVSSCFNYTEKDTLLEFFWRYGRMNEEQRGKDMSVSTPTAEEAKEAWNGLKVDGEEDCKIPLLKFTVVDDTTKVAHHFVGRGNAPLLRANSSATGRATRTFKVWDLKGHKQALLKDTWRVDLPDIEKEGDIYKELHKHNVPHISEILCAGDVHLARPVFGDNHRTCTHLYADSHHIERQDLWVPIEGLRPHTHYRIVLKSIGTSLMDFESSKQLVTAARDALEALVAAYQKAKIMHRDISCGNILIFENGGLLIDWDMSRRIPDADRDAAKPQDTSDHGNAANSNVAEANDEAKQPDVYGNNANQSTTCKPPQMERFGTWQFISARLLALNSKIPRHTLADDMESLVHVLNWIVMRYMPHNLSPGLLSFELSDIFDHCNVIGTQTSGGKFKEFFLMTHQIGNIGLKNPVMVSLLVDLSATFAIKYEPRPPLDTFKIFEEQSRTGQKGSHKENGKAYIAEQYLERRRNRKSPEWVLGLFDDALKTNGWPDNDKNAENKLPPKLVNALKRKSQEIIDENERAVVKQRTGVDGSYASYANSDARASGS